MADNFGLKLGIDGEKEFKRALSDINGSFKVLGSEMALVTSQFDKNDNSVEAVTARSKVLNKEIDEQKNKISTLRDALANAAASFGENDTRTQRWQIQLNKAQAELNNMEREVKNNNDALDKAANGFDDAEKQTEQFGNAAKDSGGKLEQLSKVAKVATAAMAASFAALGAGIVAVGKKMADASVDAAAFADEILTQSTVTGISTDKLQAYSYAAELVDVSTETMTKSMAKNIKSMSSAQQGSKNVTEAYQKIGVSVTDANGKLRDGEAVYWECIDALGKVSNETERDAIAMQIFGKSAQDLNPLIKTGAAGMKELTKEAKDAGAVLSSKQLTELGGFDDALQRIKSGAAAAKNALGTVLAPALTKFAEGGTAIIGKFTNGILEADGNFSKIGETVGTTLSDMMSKLGSYMPKITEAAVSLLLSLVRGFSDNIAEISASAKSIIETLINGITEALPEVIACAGTLLMTIATALLDNLPQIMDAALQVVIELAKGIGDNVGELIPKVIDCIGQIVTTLSEPDNLTELITAAGTIIGELAKGLIKAIPDVLRDVKIVIANIAKTFKDTDWLAVGKSIINGIWEGISSLGNWLLDKLTNFFVDCITKIFGGTAPPEITYKYNNSSWNPATDMAYQSTLAGFDRTLSQATGVTAAATGSQITSAARLQNNATGGDTFNVTIDAKNVQDFTSVVRMSQDARLLGRKGVLN